MAGAEKGSVNKPGYPLFCVGIARNRMVRCRVRLLKRTEERKGHKGSRSYIEQGPGGKPES